MSDDTDVNWKARSALWLHWAEDHPRVIILLITHALAFVAGAWVF